MYMNILSVCMCVYHVSLWCFQKTGKDVRFWVLWKKSLCSYLLSHCPSSNFAFDVKRQFAKLRIAWEEGLYFRVVYM